MMTKLFAPKSVLFSIILFSTLLLSACGRPPRGPYLQMVTPHSIIVKWVSKDEVIGTVRYGLQMDQLDNTIEESSASEQHEILLQDLLSDTTYYYQIATDFPFTGEVHTFNTAPAAGSKTPVRVWLIGDSGTADENASAVRDNFYAFNGSSQTDVWIMLGDNAYSSGTQADYQQAVFEMYPDTLSSTVVWPTLGNHDAASLGGVPYYDIFTLPTKGEAGGVASGTEAYYSFDYANIHFVCLNSETPTTSKSGAMYAWLEADLQANTQDWTVVYFHQPPYSKGSHDSDNPLEIKMRRLRENFTPLFDQYRVDLVFSGHSHAYERSYPLRGHTGTSDTLTTSMIVDQGDGREDGDGAYLKQFNDDHNGVVYTVAGSSGKTSGGSLDHPAHFISLRELGSVVLDFEDNRLDATFISPNSSVEDHFTILKN